MAIQDLGDILGLRNKLGNILKNNLTLVVRIQDLGLHYARTDGSHLWAVLGIYDSCNDIASKGRADLV